MRKGYVPVEPFREWLKLVRPFYPNGKELSTITGVAQGKLSAIEHNRPYHDGGSGMQIIDKLSLKLVDNAITREGRFHLVEFYPEVYEEN